MDGWMDLVEVGGGGVKLWYCRSWGLPGTSPTKKWAVTWKIDGVKWEPYK